MSCSDSSVQALVDAVRQACLEAARDGYEQAALAGLCHEGAMEASLDAIRALKLDKLLVEALTVKETGRTGLTKVR